MAINFRGRDKIDRDPETGAWKQAEEDVENIPAPDSSEVVDLHEIDDAASLEMAAADRHIPGNQDNPNYDPDPGPTQYDRQLRDAQRVVEIRTRLNEGARPIESEPILTDGEDIQDAFEKKKYARGGAESVHISGRDADDRWYMRWINRWRRGNNQKKRGRTNPK